VVLPDAVRFSERWLADAFVGPLETVRAEPTLEFVDAPDAPALGAPLDAIRTQRFV
jgi:hypothetical protein